MNKVKINGENFSIESIKLGRSLLLPIINKNVGFSDIRVMLGYLEDVGVERFVNSTHDKQELESILKYLRHMEKIYKIIKSWEEPSERNHF